MANNEEENSVKNDGERSSTVNNNTIELKVESMTKNNNVNHNAVSTSINGGSHHITQNSSSTIGTKKDSLSSCHHQQINNDEPFIMDFDQFLPYVGDCGRYQALIFIVMIPFCFFFAFVYFAQMFITLVPSKYYCNVPELDYFNMTEEER